MNSYFIAAAVLAFLVGLVHSILGERLIFRRLREGRVVPTHGGTLLGEGHVRILWASWHVLTVFGWGIAAILLWCLQFIPRPPSCLHPARYRPIHVVRRWACLCRHKGEASWLGWVPWCGGPCLVRKPCLERRAWHLTPPSSARPKGRFSLFGPSLMSNVRQHDAPS